MMMNWELGEKFVVSFFLSFRFVVRSFSFFAAE